MECIETEPCAWNVLLLECDYAGRVVASVSSQFRSPPQSGQGVVSILSKEPLARGNAVRTRETPSHVLVVADDSQPHPEPPVRSFGPPKSQCGVYPRCKP